MTVFIAIAAAMVVAALGWIVVPLLRRSESGDVGGDASNVSILRDQRVELDADLGNGTITREQYEHARRELETRVLEDTSYSEVSASPQVPPFAGAWTAAIVATALPIAAALLYATLGSHEAFLPVAQPKPESAQHDLSPEKLEHMIAKVEARLAKEPGNVQGWTVLANTYYALSRMPEAIRAFDQAVKLAPENADLLADYADALATIQKSIEGKPLELVARALKSDPTQWKALALAGTAAFDRKDFKLAIQYWEKLKASVPEQSEIARNINASIADAKAAGGIDSTAAIAPPSAKAATEGVDMAPPATSIAKAPGGAIAGTVSLSAAFAGQSAPTDTVYVFARAAQGPKMPLAILRKQVKDLPVTFSLDDSMAMTPEMKISNFDEVVVGARISKSGSATAQSGDLEGFSKPVKLGANGVAVVIDTTRR